LPSGSIYRSPARFDDDPNRTLGSWDIELRFDRPPAYGTATVAAVSFASSDAPTQLLHPGSTFELTEGSKVVARGEVAPLKSKQRIAGRSISATM